MSKIAKKKTKKQKSSPGVFRGPSSALNPHDTATRPARLPRDSSRQWNLVLAWVSFFQMVEVVQRLDNDSKALVFFPLVQAGEALYCRSPRQAQPDTSALAKTHCRPDSSSSPCFFSLAVSQRPGLFAQRVSPFLIPRETKEADAVL